MLNISKCQILKIGISKFAIFQITRPGFHFGVPKKRKVATKLISYERYREILFQKVASGYSLHFVLDGSSKNALDNYFLRKNIKKKWGEKNDQSPLTPLRRALFAP